MSLSATYHSSKVWFDQIGLVKYLDTLRRNCQTLLSTRAAPVIAQPCESCGQTPTLLHGMGGHCACAYCWVQSEGPTRCRDGLDPLAPPWLSLHFCASPVCVFPLSAESSGLLFSSGLVYSRSFAVLVLLPFYSRELEFLLMKQLCDRVVTIFSSADFVFFERYIRCNM